MTPTGAEAPSRLEFPHDMDYRNDVQHRAEYTAPSEAVSVREISAEDATGDAAMFAVRMPITSTTEARDGDAFTRARVEGFAKQVAAGDIGAFL